MGIFIVAFCILKEIMQDFQGFVCSISECEKKRTLSMHKKTIFRGKYCTFNK